MKIRTRKQWRRMVLILGAVVLASALGGCAETTEEETIADVAVVEAANPEIGSLKLSGEFIATIEPEASVYVIPMATAEVTEVMVSAGDTVEEGDVLALLDDTIAQITMKNAEVSAKNAQISLDNAERSYNMNFGDGASVLNALQSDNTLSQAEDGVTQLQESLVDAMTALDTYKRKLTDAEKERDEAEKEMKKAEEEYQDAQNNSSDMTMGFEALGMGSMEYMTAMTKYQQASEVYSQWQQAVTSYKSAIDQCEETIENLQDNIDSTYKSYSQAVISDSVSNGELREEQKKASENTISQAQLGVSQAQLTIEQARENLDTYTITAPISGVVETVNVREHDFATSSNPAFVISNKDAMTAVYYVSEDVRNTFSVGQQVTIEKDGMVYAGEVMEIGTAIDTTTGLFRIKARVKGDTSDFLSGTKAKVTTDTYHENNVLIIPYDAVYYDGTQAYVYTVADGAARKTNVTTGLFDEKNIVITDGITTSDLVITTWSAQLRDGVTVSIREPAAGSAQE
ncbi:MAG: efflux RND transporter periplasmic adaptor subunit [Roseburia sp.]|nr:efflux RND transporter periplasmic adaptor subunit [Roseburia sp.]